MIATPLIIIAEGDVMVFEDVLTAEGYMEPIDVDDGMYRAWDRYGAPLRVSVERTTQRRRVLPGKRTVEAVRIDSIDDETLRRSGFAELEMELRRRLSADRLDPESPIDLDAVLGLLPRTRYAGWRHVDVGP
jgi:hypothetical protein